MASADTSTDIKAESIRSLLETGLLVERSDLFS